MNETHTPDVSLDGKRNAYYVRCQRVGFSRAYAACQNDIGIKNRGAANTSSPCEIAITTKTCPGISMRKEELAEERAIYFVERIRPEPEQYPVLERQGIMNALNGGFKKNEMVVMSARLTGKPTLTGALMRSNPASYADAINSFNNKETANA